MRVTFTVASHVVTSVLTLVITLVGAVSAFTALDVLRVRNELTTSMYPFIKPGDLVVYRPTRASAVRSGEVISFLRPGSSVPVTHRVLNVTRHGATVDFATRGDNNPSADLDPTTFPDGETVWHVSTKVPGVGRYFAAMTGTHGLPFLLGLLPLFFSLPHLGRLFRPRPAPQSRRRRGAHRAVVPARSRPIGLS